jgi:hypothetical protein
MPEDSIQALLLFFEIAKELRNDNKDDDSIQKFKIKLDQLI